MLIWWIISSFKCLFQWVVVTLKKSFKVIYLIIVLQCVSIIHSKIRKLSKRLLYQNGPIDRHQSFAVETQELYRLNEKLNQLYLLGNRGDILKTSPFAGAHTSSSFHGWAAWCIFAILISRTATRSILNNIFQHISSKFKVSWCFQSNFLPSFDHENLSVSME